MTCAEDDAPSVRYQLRLLVAGATWRSQQAIENLERVCAKHLHGRVDLEVIDIYQQPRLAEKHQVIAAPTLVKLLPLPVRRIIGDLSKETRVLRGLEIIVLDPGGSVALEPGQDETKFLLERIRSRELRLEETEDTLEAIRQGEIDAVVANERFGEPRIYTLVSDDRPNQMHMQEGAVTLRPDGTIMDCNRLTAVMLNTPQEQIVGQTLQKFMPPDDAADFVGRLSAGIGTGVRYELNLRTVDGTVVPVNISLNVLRDKQRSLLCAVLTDLTTQKVHFQELAKANATLVQMNEALQRSNSVLDSFAYVASHDLKEPLRGISNFATFLRRSADAKLRA